MKLSDLSDGELLTAFGDGDDQAFAELYRRRRLELYRFILSIVRGDEELASDMFQDTFVKIHQKAHTLRDHTNVRAWMYTIARNSCLNALKLQNRHSRFESEEDIPISSPHPLPDAQLEKKDMHALLEDAITRLPEQQREAILLREYDGFSYAEIAEITGNNIDVIRQRLWRAKQSLRTMLISRLEERAEGNT
ncbi:sigma-70 family RNA polymerase sigma factor [bacterium]|nr:sigma-70 family RNA polymerase sigma factor [bacterium]